MAESRLFIYMRFWLYLLEAGWIVYGTSFIFNEEIENCESESIEKGD